MSSSLTILMTCCAGFSAWETSAPRARSLTASMKARTDGQRDVGLEQRDADLARGGVDVGVGQPALAAQAGEDLVQAVGEGLEHSTSSAESRARDDPRHLTPGYRLRSGGDAQARTASATTAAARRPITRAAPQSAQAHSGQSPPSSVCPSVHGGCTNSRDLAAGRAGPQPAVHVGSSRPGDRSVPVASTVARPTDRSRTGPGVSARAAARPAAPAPPGARATRAASTRSPLLRRRPAIPDGLQT